MKFDLQDTKEKSFWGRARNLVVVFLVLGTLMVSSSLIEFNQSKSEQIELLQEHAHSLLESIIAASTNSLLANEELERGYRERLLNNAHLIKQMYENGMVNNSILRQIAEKNKIYRLNIFNNRGTKLFFSHQRQHFGQEERFSPKEILQPIFSGEQDTLIFGVRKARFEDSFRYAVAIAAKNRSAIVLNVNASQILDFKKNIGFGVLLRKVAESEGIHYIALQDTAHILAAAGRVSQLKPIANSNFLNSVLEDPFFDTRQFTVDSIEVFEAAHPFVHHNQVVGLFRLGLSMSSIQALNTRVYTRLIIITLFLIILGTIFLTAFFTRQRYELLRHQYDIVETYSGNIIQNVSDAIIVIHETDGITVFNSSAQELFKKRENKISGKDLGFLFNNSVCSELLIMPPSIRHFECVINSERKYLLISKTKISDKNSQQNTILVIRDLTQEKLMEAQIERKERLVAMGGLASGVAHEIRNPLNTIGTIIQQLDKDFEPKESQEEYHDLAQLVYKEVKRINETVQDFLRFARPEPVKPGEFNLSELLNQLKQQYSAILSKNNIQLTIDSNYSGQVVWDRNQIQQVLMNLVQNAHQAIKSDGKIEVKVVETDKQLIISVKDNGPGMEESIQSKIFNLYFTTKAKGTGIGLSIVQRIIYEHNGIISVESNPGQGTNFLLRLPIKVQVG